MFWKIGFFAELVLILVMAFMFIKASPIKNEGAISHGDIYSSAPAETTQFLSDVFEIKSASDNHMWPGVDVMKLQADDATPGSVIYLTVKDYDATHKKLLAKGAVPVETDKYAHGARFGIYSIPGGVNIGIVQWEHVKNK